jgi:dihydroxyacid dehydratase/phosphogluconate dehydratase
MNQHGWHCLASQGQFCRQRGLKADSPASQVFDKPTISDGMSMGTEVHEYSLISREVISDCIETCLQGQQGPGAGQLRPGQRFLFL